jgi:hypothetical protein
VLLVILILLHHMNIEHECSSYTYTCMLHLLLLLIFS